MLHGGSCEFAFPRRGMRPGFAKALPQRREQGMPDARCTRGLVCKVVQKKRTRAYRFSGGNPTFPAQWLYGLYALSPAIRICLSPSPRGLMAGPTPGWAGFASARLDANPEAVRTTRLHRTLQHRRQHAVRPLTELIPPCDPRFAPDAAASTASHPTFVTMANAPLPGQDGANRKSDLPDGLSENLPVGLFCRSHVLRDAGGALRSLASATPHVAARRHASAWNHKSVLQPILRDGHFVASSG